MALDPTSFRPTSYRPTTYLPTTHRFDANGVGLAVHDWGGDGPPVLLTHPTGFHGRVWAPVASLLVGRGRHVWSFDFRGHGDSDAPSVDDDSYSWRGFADDVLAVTRHLGLEGRDDLLACGHSKGGAALIIGEQQAPGTYARIWVYEPIVFADQPAALPGDKLPDDEARREDGMARTARKRRDDWPSIDAAYASYASKPPLDALQPDALRAYVEYGLRDRGDGVYELKCRPEVEARIYAEGPRNGAYGRLPDVAAPVRVVCGETSTSISPGFGAKIARRLPRGSLEVMAGRGHFGPLQDAAAAVASMLQFAAETETARRA